jgi:hypothetical protein
MKKLLFLFFISSQAFAYYSPKVENSVDQKKTIHIVVTNESDDPIHCRWTVSWFESLLSYKKMHGQMDIFPHATEKLEFFNDPYTKIFNLKSHFECL